MAGTPQAIPGQPGQAPRYGLLVAAEVTRDDGTGWADGVTWDPESCAGGGAEAIDCGSTGELAADEGRADLEAQPFVVWAADACSTIGFLERDYEARARRLLETTESNHVAREFWQGDAGIAENTPLADVSADTVSTGTALSITDAIARLEGAVAACLDGRRAMIHMTPQAFVHAYAARLCYQAGQQWLTPLGSIIVADAGYPGTGPNGEPASSTQWAYATPLVRVRLSAVDIVPGSLSAARDYAAAMNRSINDVEVRAQRLALVEWDTCCHFAVEVNIVSPAVGGTS